MRFCSVRREHPSARAARPTLPLAERSAATTSARSKSILIRIPRANRELLTREPLHFPSCVTDWHPESAHPVLQRTSRATKVNSGARDVASLLDCLLDEVAITGQRRSEHRPLLWGHNRHSLSRESNNLCRRIEPLASNVTSTKLVLNPLLVVACASHDTQESQFLIVSDDKIIETLFGIVAVSYLDGTAFRLNEVNEASALIHIPSLARA